MLVPPRGIGSGGHETYHRSSHVRRVVGLAHERRDLGSIGWVHPAHIVLPVPQEGVIRLAEIRAALCIFCGRTNIQRETELSIQSIKQPLRCGPVRRFAAEMNGVHAWFLSLEMVRL